MIWGFPAAFWFSLVALPVAAIFLYRRRLRVVVVPAVRAWLAVGRPVEVHSTRSLLRRLFSLLVQLLLLALLVLALADPSPRQASAARTILVMDVSATLQMREEGGARIDQARRAALDLIERLPAEGEVAVLHAAHWPVLALAPTVDRHLARELLRQTDALDVEGDLQAAVRTAASLVDASVSCEVVVISDFAGQDLRTLRQLWNTPAPLRLLPVGSDHPNGAITGLWTQGEAEGRHVTASIVQRGMAGATVTATLSINGQPAESRPVQLSEEPAVVSFTAAIPAGTPYELSLTPGDALALDDHAVGVAQARAQVSICLVTRGNPPLQRALQAEPAARVRCIRHEQYSGSSAGEVVIVDGPGLAPASPANAAGYLFIGTADPFGWCRTGSAITAPAVSHWSGDHPALADVDPTLFHAPTLLELDPAGEPPPTLVAGADGATVMAELRPATGQRCLYWPFDLRDTDLPRRAALPLLLWNAIDYLAHGSEPMPQDSLPTGRPLKLVGIADAAPVVMDPLGRPLPAQRRAGHWLVPDTRRQGLYRRSDRPEIFAMNLLSLRGVQPLGREDAPVQSDERPGTTSARGWRAWLSRLAWDKLVAAAACLAAVEWLLYNRGVVRIG